MADAVTSQWLENGPRFAVGKFTNVSDATGEAGVVKIDATATGLLGVRFQGQLVYPGIHLALTEIKFTLGTMSLRLIWQGTPNVDMLTLAGTDHWRFLNERGGFGGLTPPIGMTGATGSILFTTLGAVANSTYSVIATFTKNVPQS